MTHLTHLRREPFLVATMLALTLLPSGGASAQARHFPLESTSGLRFVNAAAEPVTHQGRKGLRVTLAKDAPVRSAADRVTRQLIVIEGVEFANGVIEVEVAGTPAPGAPEAARGFVGIAFRGQDDLRTYEQFYLRPTNGRADDQVRRNHSVQYSSQPDWAFDRLRKEAPERYEAYVDLVPDVWTKIKIEVSGERARLYVHGQEQPTLIVNDLKLGAQTKGWVALSADFTTTAHFRNLTITPTDGANPR
jgi:hypothetical protein